MKKIVLAIFIAMCLFVPRTKAQDSTRLARAMYDITLDYQRGLEFGAGVYINTPRPIQVIGSYGTNSSFGIDVTFLPFLNNKWFGVGIEGVYFFSAEWNVASLLRNGNPLSDVFTFKGGSWTTRKLALSPNIKIQIPMKHCSLGFKINPFAFSSWNWYSGDWRQDQWGNWHQLHGWSGPKQYYTIAVSYQFSIAQKKFNKKK